LYDSNLAYSDDLDLRNQLVPLFDRYRVDLYLSGHEHHYERTWPLRNNRASTVVEKKNRNEFEQSAGTIYTGEVFGMTCVCVDENCVHLQQYWLVKDAN
jgi:hypothetical protein